MRKLMWFTLGFGAACGLCVSAVPGGRRIACRDAKRLRCCLYGLRRRGSGDCGVAGGAVSENKRGHVPGQLERMEHYGYEFFGHD